MALQVLQTLRFTDAVELVLHQLQVVQSQPAHLPLVQMHLLSHKVK